MFEAIFDKTPDHAGKPRGWRVRFNGVDICGALNEAVAKETAFHMNAYRSAVP